MIVFYVPADALVREASDPHRPRSRVERVTPISVAATPRRAESDDLKMSSSFRGGFERNLGLIRLRWDLPARAEVPIHPTSASNLRATEEALEVPACA